MISFDIVENVFIFLGELLSFQIKLPMVEESIPPDKLKPTLTSDLNLFFTDSVSSFLNKSFKLFNFNESLDLFLK